MRAHKKRFGTFGAGGFWQVVAVVVVVVLAVVHSFQPAQTIDLRSGFRTMQS